MGKSNVAVQVPGAPAAITPADHADPAQSDAAAAPAVDARDAEIAALRAQLAAASTPSAPQLVLEGDGPNTRRYKAESKHLHLTSTELDKLVKSGEVVLTDHHVLCKDGWYVNPMAQKQANG